MREGQNEGGDRTREGTDQGREGWNEGGIKEGGMRVNIYLQVC